MTDLSSESDCFESADEGFDDENIVNDNVNSKAGGKDSDQSGSSLVMCGTSSTNFFEESSAPTSLAVTALQYRKRPERGKGASKPMQAVLSSNQKMSLNEQIFSTDIIKPDVLIQDITSNLSKNLNIGFNTIQQTSSSIKDLVINSLPVANLREGSGRFSYDDKEEISSQAFDSDDESNVTGNENNDILKELQQSWDNENKDTTAEGRLDISPVKVMKKVVKEEGLNSEISGMDILESLDSNDMEDEFIEEKVNSNYNNMLVEGSGGGICEELQNLEIKKEKGMFKETKDVTCSLVEDDCLRKYLAEPEQDIILEKAEKLSNIYKHENVNKSLNEDMKGENHAGYNFKQKAGWDLTESVLEGLDDSEGCLVKCTCVNENKVKQEFKVEVEEKIQKMQDNEMSDDYEGWDDFDIDDEELEEVKNVNELVPIENTEEGKNQCRNLETSHSSVNQATEQSVWDKNKNFGSDAKWSGWGNFGEKQDKRQGSGWNLGNWGVNALLNTATSVTQGLTNVIEAGLGVPDPETLAQMEYQATYNNDTKTPEEENVQPNAGEYEKSRTNKSGLNLFPKLGITDLVVGVTKNIVETTKVHEIGTKVLAGGLDTLESFGKKTMEVLQEGDPGLKKKRALLLGSDKPVLSQVLREAKSKAEHEDKRMEEQQLARLCHFETLFDDFQGLIHLEALEMLSRQCELKLEQIKASLSANKIEDLTAVLDEVKDLCIVDEDEFKSNYSTMVDFKISLAKATEPLKNEISIQKIIEVHQELDSWLKNDENTKKPLQSIFQKAMSTLAELTAVTVAQFHKGGELLSIKEHRKTVEEADALLQMTGFLCCEIHNISKKFLKLHTICTSENDKEIAIKIKGEANNATIYIKDAFNLLIPVLQLGAAI